LSQAKRQMLHASQLSFSHPFSGAALQFQAPLTSDMAHIIQQLREIEASQ
jgi:hypothetical protein